MNPEQDHHEFRAPIAAATGYGHPVDGVLVATLPIGIGPFLTGCHLSTTWVWYLVISFHTVMDHCGYHLPFFRSNQAHEFHHRAGHSNYGNWGRVMDALHGTDRRFEFSLEHRRDRRLVGLTPVSALVPSDKDRENNNGK